jgi:hypothetical protein
MAVIKVWITPDKRWRVSLTDRGRYEIVGDTLPRAEGRGGEREARAALEALPDAPSWDDLIED